MPAAAAGAVISWATAAGASAAFAAGAGAVASAVVTGAIAGAAIGAATAIMTGENILKGALKGAAIGGVSGGVFSGLSMAAHAVTSGAVGSSAATQLGNIGLSTTGAALEASEVGSGVGGSTYFDGTGTGTRVDLGGASGKLNIPGATPDVAPGIMSDTTKELVGHAVQGVGSGAGEYLSGKEKAEGAKEIAQFQAGTKAMEKATNVPGEFEAQTANALIPDTWLRYIDPAAANAHLAAKGGVA